MLKLPTWALALAGASLVSTPAFAGIFADTIISYDPGSGFAAGFTNPATSLGPPTASATPFSPAFQKSQLVSLGAGGSLTVQFPMPVQNDSSHPYGLDFTIYGNTGFTITNGNFSGGGITDGSLFGNNTGATRVSVSQDNHTYYELNPALAPTVDGLFPTDGSGDSSLPVNPSLSQASFAGLNLAGIRSLYNGSAGGGSFDISWAEDASGNAVSLNSIDYVRIDVLSGKSEVDAISVVPEPATWVLLLVGSVLFGWRCRQLGHSQTQVIPCKQDRKNRKDFAGKPLQNIKTILVVLWAATSIARADTFTENFATDPAARGWQTFGDAGLFHWNSTNQNMDVTWDSSQPNSYFHRPLGTILSKSDDFSLSFDLRLADIAIGTDTNMPYTFELAIGLIHFGDATNASFLRGTGYSSPNLVEFDYFPDSGYGATVAPTLISSNDNFNDGGFTFPLALSTNALFHVAMTYTASDQTLVTLMTSNGVPFGPVADATLNPAFGDFRVDQVAISSYSDAGQDPAYVGSILAHGTVGNFVVNTPPAPVLNLTGGFSNSLWQVRFTSHTNWLYTLERTVDLQSWTASSPTAPGNGGSLSLQDTNASAARAFYRVRAGLP